MRRVIKVGGSLLSRPNLPDSLTRWFARQSKAENLVIVGGGELVESIRRLDQLRPSEPVDTHWLCVDLLESTRKIFANWFEWESLTSGRDLRERIRTGFSVDQPTLVAVPSFYHGSTDFDAPLDWRTTSDTIAALLALTAAADELVLLKNCDVDPNSSIAELVVGNVSTLR